MQESLEQSILEDETRRSLEDKQLMRKAVRMDAPKLLVGLAVGLVVLGSAIVLVNFNGLQWGLNGEIWGLLLLPLGLWITASAILGGLGPSAQYGLWLHRVMFTWWNWIGSEESEKREENDENERAEPRDKHS